MLTLGNGYDGVITHFDAYDSMDKMALKADLITYLESTKYKQELWFSYTPDEILDKIFHSNANEFLKLILLNYMSTLNFPKIKIHQRVTRFCQCAQKQRCRLEKRPCILFGILAR